MNSQQLGLSCGLLAALLPALTLAEDGPPLRVMSYNIRYGTAKDGENHWDLRKEFLVETIKAFGPDLLGTQETLGFQRGYLAEELPAYDQLGIGREDGGDKGEMTAVFFKRERFEKLAGGHFWLSETPDKVGSKSWDSSLPRMVTWLKLRDRQNAAAPPVVCFNTHFDHRGPTARLESSKLIRRQMEALAKDAPIILTGDFNAGEASEPYKALFDKVDSLPTLLDSYRLKHPKREPNEGTFSDFKSSTITGARIDWIAVSPHWRVSEAGIDRTERDGRTPSDHFAVTAVVRQSELEASP